MKKIKLLKVFLFFIAVFSCFTLGNKVYGYQLKYKAIANNSNIYFLSMGNAFGAPPITSGFSSPSNRDSYVDLTKTSVYQTYKFMLQSASMTKYDDSRGYNVNYATSNNNVITEDNYSNYSNSLYGKGTTKVNGYNDNVSTQDIRRGVSNVGSNIVSIYKSGGMNVKNTFLKNSVDSDFKLYKTRIIAGPEGSGETIEVSKWEISLSKLKNLININESSYLKTNNDSNGKYIWFSLPCILHNGNTLDPRYFYVALDTAYDAVCGFHSSSYDETNTGYDFASYSIGLHVEPPFGTQSIINLYDNQMYLPDEFMDPQEVYIRHVDEKGNVIDGIQNSSEVLINSDEKESIVNNSKSPDGGYSEYYKISLNQKIRASRSLVIAKDGVTYDYTGAEMVNASTLKDAKKLLGSSSKTTNNIAVTTSTSSKKNVTIITFKYKQDKGSNTPDTQSKIESISGDSGDETCENIYTPTDEDIKPYLITNKYLLKDLKYGLKQNGDKVIYKMSTFNINKLSSGQIANNGNAYGDTGAIFGDDTQRWTLLNGTSPQTISLKNLDLSELNNFRKDYDNKLPTSKNIEDFIKSNKTKKDDFKTVFHIPANKYNGIRSPKLTANYQAYDVINKSNINGSLSQDATNKLNVIVYNPLDLKPVTVTSEGVIDHTTTDTTANVLQKNAKFTVKFGTQGSSYYSQITDTSKYLDYYYMVFDIDIVLESDYQIKEFTGSEFTALKTAKSGGTVKAGTLIKIDKGATEFKALASNNTSSGDIISQIENNVVLIGVSNNMPSDTLESLVLSNVVKKYSQKLESTTEKYINTTTTSNSIEFKDYCDDKNSYTSNNDSAYTSVNMYNDAYYFAMAKAKTTNIGRIYDFKITDCSDIDYKSVFRKSTSSGGVNALNGTKYYSGIKWFNIYTYQVNTLENRDDINIEGTSSKKILPLGPYKSTNTSYINAPKLGYRISFDLKTSGFFDYNSNASTREILIKPTYYYISKDATTFKDSINLYYKNSSGKYVNLSGSDYTIYFKPNDGYRSIYNESTAGNIKNMSSTLEPLVIGSSNGFTLNSKMMSTSDNQFIQAWYGEFKLPNSTIAVDGTNISNPLTDGYIGVKFHIECIDSNSGTENKKIISYNQNNKNDKDSSGNLKPNTTQWDYEGYLGFTNYGNEASDITLQLEKGVWKINNAIYNKIKGTVVLFDTDNRAANDFE